MLNILWNGNAKDKTAGLCHNFSILKGKWTDGMWHTDWLLNSANMYEYETTI